MIELSVMKRSLRCIAAVVHYGAVQWSCVRCTLWADEMIGGVRHFIWILLRTSSWSLVPDQMDHQDNITPDWRSGEAASDRNACPDWHRLS